LLARLASLEPRLQPFCSAYFGDGISLLAPG
jgi:hypothetical protein